MGMSSPTLSRDRIGSEFVGLTRHLRDSIGEHAIPSKLAIERLVKPLRPKPGFRPMPRHSILKQVRDRWLRLPSYGRLEVTSSFEDGKLRCGEIRLFPSR